MSTRPQFQPDCCTAGAADALCGGVDPPTSPIQIATLWEQCKSQAIKGKTSFEVNLQTA